MSDKIDKEVVETVNKLKHKYPSVSDEIDAFFDLYISEIDSGESPSHEYELMMQSIDYTIEGSIEKNPK